MAAIESMSAFKELTAADVLVTEAQATMPHAHILKKNGGPGEVVYNWCSEGQKGEFNASLIKQADANFSYGALEGIAVEEPIGKDGGITSRALYVNKLFNVGGWKASIRWIKSCHKEPDAGRYETSPTKAELLDRQFPLLRACMFRWPVWCGDI